MHGAFGGQVPYLSQLWGITISKKFKVPNLDIFESLISALRYLISIQTTERHFIIFYFYRYSYVVHPLAYRDTTNQLPDNSCVDAIQWSILNINNKLEDPHYNNPKEFYNPCLGLELFNDFPYSFSYNSELQTKPMDDPDFTIPCFNGKID